MSKSTELTKPGPAELTPFQQWIMAEEEIEENAFTFKPPRLKLGSGGITGFVTAEGEVLKEIVGVIALSQVARAYWPEAGTGKPPLCSSMNGLVGIFNADAEMEQLNAAGNARNRHPALKLIKEGGQLPDVFRCSTCPLNDWGSEHQRRSGKQGRGKACRELRRTMVLVEGFSTPVFLTLPPTSITGFDNYASGLKARGSNYYAVLTKVTLQQQKSSQGDTYSMCEFNLAGHIEDPNEWAFVSEIRRQFKEMVSGSPIVAEEYETTGNGSGITAPDDLEQSTPF